MARHLAPEVAHKIKIEARMIGKVEKQTEQRGLASEHES
jgi:hypothetical protein